MIRNSLRFSLVAALFWFTGVANAGTPVVTTVPPAEDFVGETSCFNANFSNSNAAEPGYSPYYRVVLGSDYTLSSAEFQNTPETINTEGVFPAAPNNTLIDSLTGDEVTGPEGSTLYTVAYPIGSVTSGSPDLAMELCFDVNGAAVVDVLQSNAISIAPGFILGDSATGANGPQNAAESQFDFTPRLVTYSLDNMTPEGERPPGPAWAWDIEACADIATGRVASPLDFGTVDPIVLPANVQFQGPITFTGAGTNCTAITTPADLSTGPGGQIDLNCDAGTGLAGNDAEICATFPVYIVNTLDNMSCASDAAINSAEHVTIQKGSNGGSIPGAVRNYTIAIQVSEFVPGIDRLEITDVMPDGLTFNDDASVDFGAGPIALSGAFRTISTDTPALGDTTVVYFITNAAGVLPATANGTLTYSATIDQTYSQTTEPVLSRDVLTNNVAAAYDISGAGNATNCSNTSQTEFTIDDIIVSKTLIDPPSGVVQPGENVTFRLRMEIPSGDIDLVVFEDFFPLPVFDSTSIDTNTNIAANTDISFTTNDTLGLTPTSITASGADNSLRIEWGDVSSTTPEIIEIDIVTTVSDEPFADNLTLSNLFQATTDNTPADNDADLTTTSISVRAPTLALEKTVTSASTGLQPTDTVTYNITATNESTAEAYDVVIADDEPAGLTSCVLDSVTGGAGAGGDSPFDIDGFEFTSFDAPTAGALDGGASVTLTVSCTVDLTVTPGQTITNTASVVWASAVNATPFSAAEATADVTTANADTPVKSVDSTSESATPESTPRPLAVGEIVRFRMSAEIPEGAHTNMILFEAIPPGLQFLDDGTATIAFVSTAGGAITASGFTQADCAAGTLDQTGVLASIEPSCVLPPFGGTFNSGDNVALNIGDVTSVETDADQEFILIEVNALALGDLDNGSARSNRFRLVTDETSVTSPNTPVQFVEPELVTTKDATPTTVDAGDTITYVITVAHTGDSLADAFDITLTDALDGGNLDNFAFVSGPIAPAGETCTAANAVVDSADPFGAGINITFDGLPLGEICQVTFTASVQASVIPGTDVINTASTAYDGLVGTGDPSNTTGSTQGTPFSATADDTATVSVQSTVNTKSIESTSFTHTADTASGASAANARPVSIGETVRYRLEVQLPEGNAPDFTLTDTLPAGLIYQVGTARLAFLAEGAGISATPGITCSNGGTLSVTGDETNLAATDPDCQIAATGGPFLSGTDPVFALGDLMNDDMDADQEFVILEFDALVANATSNQQTVDLDNTFDLTINGASIGMTTTAFTEVVEPQMVCTATAVPNPVDNRTDTTPTITLTYALANAGAATAFQAGAPAAQPLVIDLPAGLENISALNVATISGDVFNNNTVTAVTAADFSVGGTDNRDLTASSLFQFGVGAALEISFEATLQAGVLPGDVLNDICVIAYRSQAAGDNTTGVRDDNTLATGQGNDPITDTASLNDYREEAPLAINTIAEDPEIGLAKAVTAGPTNNADGTYAVTYTLTVENSGDVGLETVSILEDLATTFGPVAFAVDDVAVTSTNTTLLENPAFTGSAGNTDLLVPGSSTLGVGDTGSIVIQLTLTPGANLGAYPNTATVSADSDRTGNTVNDTSEDGLVPDEDGDGDPTNDSAPTPLTLAEAPEIGIAKSLVAAPTNNGDGTYSFQYQLFVENTGDVELAQLQIVDDLAATFAGAASFTVTNVSSADFSVAFPGFTGTAPDTNLLDASDTLAPGADGTLVIDVTLTPGGALGTFLNTATASGLTPSGTTVSDDSNNGGTPDGNGDGDPTNDGTQTPVTVAEAPELGLAKTLVAVPVNNGDGTYTFQYQFVIENSGDVELRQLQVIDDLAAIFTNAAAFTVSDLSSTDFTVNFPGFDGTPPNAGLLSGTDVLAVGASGTVLLEIILEPGADLGPYNNTATGQSVSPSGGNVNDVSDNGVVPDGDADGDPTNDSDVTPVSFVEGPIIGVAKQVTTGPVNNADGTYSLTYTFVVENAGDIALNDIAVLEDLSATFAAADSFVIDSLTSADFTVNTAGFTGAGANTDLLVPGNSLDVGASGSIALALTVTPGAALGQYDNQVTASGTSPANVTVTDTSADGTDPDADNDSDPRNDTSVTPVVFAENAVIGVAKAIVGIPVNNGDGSYTLSYNIFVENAGDVDLADVQVTESLATTFAGATFAVDALTSAEIAVNFPGFDGTGNTDLIAVGESLSVGDNATLTLTVTVTPGGNLGPYNNTAVASATAPSGATPTDDSTNGTDPDPGNDGPGDDNTPTDVTFSEDAEIGVAKAITAGPVNNGDGSYALTYTLIVENSGDVALDDVQVAEPLATTFAGATFVVNTLSSADIAVNSAGFDGVGDTGLLSAGVTLAAGESGTIVLELTVTPGANLGPYNNTATASGTSPSGATPTDTSDDGNVPDQNGDGDPGNDDDPTTITFAENPSIGIAKAVTAGPVNNADGSYALTYSFVVENAGDVDLADVQIDEPLATTFAGATFVIDSLTSTEFTVAAPGFDGDANTGLLAAGNTLAVGASGTVVVALTVTPGANLGPYNNTATASANSPSDSPVTDASDDGTVPDQNSNGDPGDDSDPTPITFAENPALGVAKAVTTAQPNYDNTFTTTVSLVVENLGDVDLTALQIDEPLASNFAPATVVGVSNLTVAGALTQANAGFDGNAVTDLLSGTETLAAGAQATVSFDLIISLDNAGQCVAVPLSNSVTASGLSPAGATLTDLSISGVDPDPDSDGNAGNNDEATAVIFATGVDGVLTVPAEILPRESVTISLQDADQNRDPAVAETVTATVTNARTSEVETIVLVETGPATGVFSATLPTLYEVPAGTDNDGTLNAIFDDVYNVSYEDTLSAAGCVTPITASGRVTGLATLVGNAWLDNDTDDVFDAGETPLDGWLVEVRDGTGALVATVAVAPDGSYTVPDLIPGDGFTVTLVHPDTGTTFGTITDITLPPDTTVLDQNLPIDPSGVVYDSVTREPVPGVTVRLVDANGDALPEACLLPAQQAQTTAADGFYRFDVVLGADPACPSGATFFVEFDVPGGYQSGFSELIPPLPDPIDPTGLGDPLRVGTTGTAPTGTDSTDYYTGFTLSDNDPDVVYNHLPLDPLGVETSSVRLTKRVDRPTTTIGSLVAYTITIENLSPVTLPLVAVEDSLPPGFTYVDGSARLDGVATGFTVSGPRPVIFDGIRLEGEQRRVLRYLLRVGAGVTQGRYVNTAAPTLNGLPIGNDDSAEVDVVADPDFEETTIIGKVWHDRDNDGWQDPADATDLVISGGPFGEGRQLGVLAGRRSEGDNLDAHTIELTLPFSDAPLTLTSAEGTRFFLAADGTTSTDHDGDVKRGRNGQDLVILRERLMTVESTRNRTVMRTDTISLDQLIEPVRFASGKAAIPQSYVERLGAILAKFDDKQNVRLRFVGHTDNEPLSARTAAIYQDNQGLSESRARTVGTFVRDALNLATSAIETSGRGETQPVASNATREGMQQNRRVEIFIVYDEEKPFEVIETDIIAPVATGEMLLLIVNRGIAEEGIAGVRLATVEGLVIETDAKGRYHIAGVDGGFMERGRNFIVKVDPATLPKGSEFTTENPRVKRISQGLLTPFDFGVLMPRYAAGVSRQQTFEFAPAFFAKDSSEMQPRFAHLMDELVSALTDAKGGRVVVLASAGDQQDRLAMQRAKYLGDTLRRRLPKAVWMAVEVYVMAENVEPKAKATTGFLQRAGGVLLSLFISNAYADDVSCTLDHCYDDNNAIVRVVEPLVTEAPLDAPLPEGDGRYRIAMPGGGVVFATEDAVAMTPRLAIAGPEHVSTDHQGMLTFVAYTNYGAFIEDATLTLYRESDVDRVRPIAELSPLNVPQAFSDFIYFEWEPPLAQAFRTDERLAYVLTVSNSEGQRDETAAGFTQFVDRDTFDELQTKAMARFDRATDERQMPPLRLAGESRFAPHEAERIIRRVYGRSQLVRQNMVLHGSRVRLQGHDFDRWMTVYIDGHWLPLDTNGSFAAEYLLPIGSHNAELAVNSSRHGTWLRDIPVDVTGSHTFLVALADLTAASNSLSGALEPLSGNDRYAEDSLVEGRLAFYLKARIKGRYLLTGQMDSSEEQLDDLLGALDDKDPRSLIRRLDPDRYYPVYGDDSTTVADANSLGRLYVRFDWDKSHASWGNFQTAIDANEFIQYRRTLYGAEFDWESTKTTRFDDSKTRVSVFGSETQTALGHSEFLGTGGSLYYLRHLDVIPGSDQARIEVRDQDTNRVVDIVPLARGRDYEIDELQGRILLGRPLLQVAQQASPSIIREGPLDGNVAILIVDYEYVPAGFDADDVVAGGRVRHWFGDYVGVGVTYLEEGRGGEDYSLGGVDLTLRAGEGTYLKVEGASSEATQTERLFSTDGGLSFTRQNPVDTANRAGDAIGVESRINLAELGWTERDMTAAAWWRRTDDQFSIARRDDGVDVYETGAEFIGELTDTVSLAMRYADWERETQLSEQDLSVQLDWRLSERGTLSTESRWISQSPGSGPSVDAQLAAIAYSHQVTDWLGLSIIGQGTIDNDDGQYDNNDLVTVGVDYALTNRTTALISASTGHRGDGATLSLEHEVNGDHTVYGSWTHSTDRSDNANGAPLDALSSGFNENRLLPGNTIAVGHRSRLSNQIEIFNESSAADARGPVSLGHVFGLTWTRPSGFSLGTTLQHSDVNGDVGLVERSAVTLSGGYRSAGVNWTSRIEYRDDSSFDGLNDLVQWASINRFDMKFSESWRLLTRLNYVDTEDGRESAEDAKLVEGGLGVAYRPVDDNRLNWLAKYTYLYDLTSPGQVNTFGELNVRTDQRSHILSLEGVRRFGPRWSLGGKIARRVSQLRIDRSTGEWFDSTVNFGALRARYHVRRNWDALAEYRFLSVDEADSTRYGWLVGVDRHVGEHLKVGIGYNFTDFSDDLTNLDYEFDGFFLNVVGKY